MEAGEDNRFIQLVLSFHSSAWVALGKVANPLSGKIERDLNVASSSIDMLEMLKVKTEGNLDEKESKLISSCLSALQINYVDEVRADKAHGGEKPNS